MPIILDVNFLRFSDPPIHFLSQNIGSSKISSKILFRDILNIDLLKFRVFGNQSEFFEPKNLISQDFSKIFVDRLANFEIFEVQIQKNILSDMLKSWIVGDWVHGLWVLVESLNATFLLKIKTTGLHLFYNHF